MAAPTTTIEHTTATDTRAEFSPETKIWDEADKSRKARIADARGKLGPDTQLSDVLTLAYADQLMFLESFTEDEVNDLTTHDLTIERIALLMLETPSAAEAIRTLDSGFNDQEDRRLNRTERLNLAEIASQFNQDLSGVLTYMPKSMIPRFAERFLEQANKQVVGGNAESMHNDRFNRAMVGMTCEVAFGRALRYNKPAEWSLRPATAAEDARGWDLKVREGQLEITIDIKSDEGFLRKLDSLVKAGDMTDAEHSQADELGYFKIDGKYVVNADALGKIKAFEYVTEPDEDVAAVVLVHKLLKNQREENLRKVSRSVINRTA